MPNELGGPALRSREVEPFDFEKSFAANEDGERTGLGFSDDDDMDLHVRTFGLF